MPISRTKSLNTEANAAVCEYDTSKHLLCGTYHLVPGKETDGSDGERKGKLLVLREEKDEFVVIQHIEVPGILDVRPHHHETALMLADGTVRFFLPDPHRENLTGEYFLEELQSLNVASGLCLAGAWSSSEENATLAVSDSSGGIGVVRICDEEYQLIHHRIVHSYEVWSVCWDSQNDSVIYSGADDSLLKVTDLRSEEEVSSVRGHDAGVTSIVSGTPRVFDLITGSYDENIRCWDTRMLVKPVAQLKLGGGVWRIKVNPEDPTLLACACMQEGAKIVEFKDTEFRILETFMEDRELTYGIDWSPEVSRNRKSEETDTAGSHPLYSVAACSFYDHILDGYEFSKAEVV